MREIEVLKYNSPFATARTASRTSLEIECLTRYPRAPACSANLIYSSFSCWVRIRNLAVLPSFSRRSVASTPLMPGMLMSMMTTSGFVFNILSIASCPSPASPITFRSRSFWRREMIPSRTILWSSAMNTLIMRLGILHGRHLDVDFRPPARHGVDDDAASDQFDALGNVFESKVSIAVLLKFLRIESATVIRNRKSDRAVIPED